MFAGLVAGVAFCLGLSILMKKKKVAAKTNQIITYIVAGIVGLVVVFAMIFFSESRLFNESNKSSSCLLEVERDGCLKVEVKAKFLHDFVKKEMLKTDRDAYTIDVDGNVFYDEYVEVDASRFGVDEAYALSCDGNELGTYIFVEDKVIIRARIDEEYTKEQIQEMFD